VLGFDGKTGAIGFYVGGKRVVAATVAPGGLAPVNAKLTIGDAGECGDSFVGLVDQVELRKAPLSPQQVCELAGRNASCDGAAPRIRFRDAGTNLQVDITDEDGLGEEAVQRSLMVWIGGQHQPPLAKPVLLSNGYRLTIPKNALVVAGLARILEVRVVDERGNRAQNAFDGSFVAQPNQSQPGAAPLAPPTTERLLPGPDPQLIALTALAAIAALMSRRMRRPRSRAIAVGLLLAAGCWSEQRNGQTDDELDRMRKDGQRLFETGEFGGNGRHCSSCHPSDAAFTITPAYVQQLFATNPDDPLFDEAAPIGPEQELASKLLRDGALLPVTIALPQGVEQVGSTSRTAILYRGVPTVRGVARTAPYLRDGRARTLEDQAKGAVETHMGGTISDYDAKAISEYERSLVHAPVPPLDDRGKRGEALFLGKARCAACHHPSNDFAGGRGVFGWQFARVLAPDPKDLPVPMRAFRFASEPTPQCQKPPRIDATTTDPGRAAVTGAAADLHHFDIPSLRGIRETAPYFHNNSAGTLPEVVKHYDKTFNLRLSSAEQSDLVGYLEAL
jgi:cytochrome c peroxidase